MNQDEEITKEIKDKAFMEGFRAGVKFSTNTLVDEAHKFRRHILDLADDLQDVKL